jgi:hypothetical protein
VILVTRPTSPDSLEPELSPLHNPILAENLDRWARVYAAAPPECRTQAIQQLLRELQAGEPDAGQQGPAAVSDIHSPAHPFDFACQQCGKMNEHGQKYCGFCGAETPAMTVHSFASPVGNAQAETRNPGNGNSENSTSPDPLPSKPASTEHVYGSNQLDSLREISFSTFYDSEESHSNGWRYTLAILVIIGCLGVLGYVKWRTEIRAAWAHVVVEYSGQTTNSQQSASASTANPQPAAQLAARPAQSATVNTPNSSTSSSQAIPEASTSSDQAKSNVPSASSQTEPSENSADTNSVANTTSDDASTPTNPLTRASKVDRSPVHPVNSSPEPTDDGSAELATAQQYLNGTSDTRNTVQAASWLWKAVSKQNPIALVLLSDLYVHGDGVPQSCEQARMLLVAAARKNAPNAETRLRNLESSGCR